MELPKQYEFLNSVERLPVMLKAGLKYLGVHEKPGPGSNPGIYKWIDNLSIRNIYKDDDESWCAVFINELCHETNKLYSGTGYDLIRAISFHKNRWGGERTGHPQLGDIIVLSRPGGNHVGIAIAESDKTIHIFGGNQSNKVGFIEIDKRRVTSVRVPLPVEQSRTYYINSTGRYKYK